MTQLDLQQRLEQAEAKYEADFKEMDRQMSVLEQTGIALQEERDALQQQANGLAAESLAKSDRLQRLVEIIDKADNRYCMCGESMETHDQIGGCGSPSGMFDYHYGQWLESRDETPATDAIKRQWMAEGLEEYGNLTVDIGREQKDLDIDYAGRQALLYAAQLRQPEEKGHE